MSRPTLRTEFCDRVGIEYPVISAGMGPVAGTGEPVATAELVAAVSNAGGLGVIGGVAYSPDALRAEIRKVRALTVPGTKRRLHGSGKRSAGSFCHSVF